jgi:[acyl-carrier-protein] S-malonyltransferase
MDAAAGGKMAALMKFDREQLATAIAANSDVVLANDNSAEQVVISGTPEAVDAILSQVKAKRTVPLKVSGAFHSPFMANATQEFQKKLETIAFNDAQVPVLSNVEPAPATAATELKQRLIAQMTGNVRWREIMLELPELGISQVIEVGPGKVLTGLLKRTCPDIALKNVRSLTDF